MIVLKSGEPISLSYGKVGSRNPLSTNVSLHNEVSFLNILVSFEVDLNMVGQVISSFHLKQRGLFDYAPNS